MSMVKLKYNQYSAEVVADSISEQGHRLISVEATMARFVLAELNTHRLFSRNSASSRAIPLLKQLDRILEKPYTPKEWGQNMPGMSSREILPVEEAEKANQIWHKALGFAALCASHLIGGLKELEGRPCQQAITEIIGSDFDYDKLPSLEESKVHKQFANRLLEPFMYHTVLITATEWDNFFSLRIDEAAQPEIHRAARLIKEAVQSSTPLELETGQWHLPYVDEQLKEDVNDLDTLKKVSVARSARLSYLNQQKHQQSLAEGQPLEEVVMQDVQLFDNLVNHGHMSPLEHVATPFSVHDWSIIEDLRSRLPTNHYMNQYLTFQWQLPWAGINIVKNYPMKMILVIKKVLK